MHVSMLISFEAETVWTLGKILLGPKRQAINISNKAETVGCKSMLAHGYKSVTDALRTFFGNWGKKRKKTRSMGK